MAMRLGETKGLHHGDNRMTGNLEELVAESKEGLVPWSKDLTGKRNIQAANTVEEKAVLIIGTLDTKGEECIYIRELLQKSRLKSILIDPGSMGEPVTRGDISRDEVASRSGFNLRNLVGTRDKGKIIQAMTDGLTAWVSDLYSKGKIQGVIALGGGQALDTWALP
jgi:hypothetical protein